MNIRNTNVMVQTAQIGVSMLLVRNDKILIAKRDADKDYGAGWWELPSGRVEDGESLKAALFRETREELGISVDSHSLIDAYTFSRGKEKMLLLTYLIKAEGKLQISDEHSEFRWINPEDASDFFQFNRQVYVVDNYLKLRNCLE